MSGTPITCSLGPSALAARRAGLLGSLVRQSVATLDLPDGRRFTFEGSTATLELITRAIDAERQCCQFLRFTLTVEPALGACVLDLTGPPGTREFLADLLRGST
jgi:hypothetical protein